MEKKGKKKRSLGEEEDGKEESYMAEAAYGEGTGSEERPKGPDEEEEEEEEARRVEKTVCERKEIPEREWWRTGREDEEEKACCRGKKEGKGEGEKVTEGGTEAEAIASTDVAKHSRERLATCWEIEEEKKRNEKAFFEDGETRRRSEGAPEREEGGEGGGCGADGCGDSFSPRRAEELLGEAEGGEGSGREFGICAAERATVRRKLLMKTSASAGEGGGELAFSKSPREAFQKKTSSSSSSSACSLQKRTGEEEREEGGEEEEACATWRRSQTGRGGRDVRGRGRKGFSAASHLSKEGSLEGMEERRRRFGQEKRPPEEIKKITDR